MENPTKILDIKRLYDLYFFRGNIVAACCHARVRFLYLTYGIGLQKIKSSRKRFYFFKVITLRRSFRLY